MKRLLCVIALSALLAPASALAWHEEGHAHAARAAVEALPDGVPAFFRQGEATIAHAAIDPDVFRDHKTPQLRSTIGPDHYFDLELLQGRPLPETRYELLALCEELGVPPRYVGALPYAIAERMQRLTLAFAEHRAAPDNPHIRAKCLLYAGLLAHYAADLHMPLHTTIHFDGRRAPDEKPPFTGIHERVDALPGKLRGRAMFRDPLPAPTVRAEAGEPMPFIFAELDESHALVGRVYELEGEIPALDEPRILNNAVRAFTIERMRASASFLADLYLTAWANSAEIDLPGWLDRDPD